MYGQLNKLLRSKMALWGITFGAIALFCLTAAVAFGINERRQNAVKPPAEKIPAVQPTVSGLQVLNSSSATATSAQLQGQKESSLTSQPAATAASSALPELSGGIAAAQVQAGANGASVDASVANTSVSQSLQPVGGNGIQTQIQAGGSNLNLDAKLP